MLNNERTTIKIIRTKIEWRTQKFDDSLLCEGQKFNGKMFKKNRSKLELMLNWR